jgi:hypothetical protein
MKKNKPITNPEKASGLQAKCTFDADMGGERWVGPYIGVG